MTTSSSAKNAAADALERYAGLLNARKAALMQILRTSSEMRVILTHDATPDISDALARRSEESQRFASLNDARVDDARLLNMAEKSLNSGSESLRQAAASVIAAQKSLQPIADEILQCQKECETLFKARISATSKAIRESAQRRALNAAYGPTFTHRTPTFLDRQR